MADSDPFLALRDRICALAAPRRADRVVDLGTGTGLLALALAPQVEHVYALDLSAAMLDRLREKAAEQGIGNIETLVADLRTLPLPDESAELVVSNYAFHHLDDAGKEIALAEVRRVLAPGGRLVLCDMMFSFSLRPRDRRLLLSKLVAIARRGPAGWWRIARNAGRVATGRWEHPAPTATWERMLRERHFACISVEALEHEGGLAYAERPLEARPGPPAEELPSGVAPARGLEEGLGAEDVPGVDGLDAALVSAAPPPAAAAKGGTVEARPIVER